MELFRHPCERICDVEWCSMICFLRRGYIWDKSQHSFLYDEHGMALRTGKKECDWDPHKPETPIMPGGFGAGEGVVHYAPRNTK